MKLKAILLMLLFIGGINAAKAQLLKKLVKANNTVNQASTTVNQANNTVNAADNSIESTNAAIQDTKKTVTTLTSLLGNKKKGEIAFQINGIGYSDQNLQKLKDAMEHVKGIKEVSKNYKDSVAVLSMSYKGDPAGLWEEVSASEKQPFRVVEASDDLMILNYVKQ